MPATSDTMTVIRPLMGPFRPLVARALGDWTIGQRTCPVPFGSCGVWLPVGVISDTWSDKLPSTVRLEPPVGRILLVGEDGEPIEQPAASFTTTISAVSARVDIRRDLWVAP